MVKVAIEIIINGLPLPFNVLVMLRMSDALDIKRFEFPLPKSKLKANVNVR